jgi:hypothetical protein
MAKREYHVEPEGNGRWRVRRGDLSRPDGYYENQHAAISAARVLAHMNVAGVFIHEGNGKARVTDHHGDKVDADLARKIRLSS